MARQALIQTNLNAGELSPKLEGRIDIGKYGVGLKRCENFIPMVQGPVTSRAGTRYVAGVKDHADRTWLVPFVFSATDGWVLEFGDQYIRFYTNRGQVLSGGSPYEISSPYALADLTASDGTFRINYVQSADVVYLVHPDYAPRKLSRTASTNWTLEAIEFDPPPFQDVNTNTDIDVWASATTGSVTLRAKSGIFDSSMVGEYFFIESNYNVAYTPWETAKAVTAGNERRSDGNIYSAGNSATTGSVKPTHTEGSRSDGAVTWGYLHSGYGWVEITAVTSISAVNRTITGAANNGSGLVRITSNAHGFLDNDTVTITGVTGTTEANGTWFVTGVTANTFDLVGSAFVNAYVSGGNAASVPGSRATATVISTLPSTVTTAANAHHKWAKQAWSDTYGWPSHVTFFRDRLTFARGNRVWMSVAGDYENFSSKDGDTVTADMAIDVQLVSSKVNNVQWMAASGPLIIGSSGSEFTLSEITSSDPLGPDNVKASPQGEYGSRGVQALRVGESVLFMQRSGRKVREIKYSFESDAYVSVDVSVLSEHITKGGIVSWTYAQEPDSIVWAARADGVLLGFTFNREQDVLGWSKHEIGGTNAVVESVCSIPSPDATRDDLWMIVRRTINGATKRYVEYLTERHESGEDAADYLYLDCGATYDGSPATTISGLGHLEGQTVGVLADGAAHPNRVVTSAQITLQAPASVAQIGLPYEPVIQTMRLEGGSQNGTAQGKNKRISSVSFRLLDTNNLLAGPDEDNLDRIQFRKASDPMDEPTPLYSGDKKITWPKGYETDGYVTVKQDLPLPTTIVAIMPTLNTYD